MRSESLKFLYDILESCRRLREFTDGKSFADYEAESLLRAGVERQFEIIGEALNRLAKVDIDAAETIPEYRRIIAFGNILIHGYDAISNRVVWDIVKTKLPGLVERVESLLRGGK